MCAHHVLRFSSHIQVLENLKATLELSLDMQIIKPRV